MTGGRVGVFTRIFRNESTIGRAIGSVLNQTYRNLRYYILVNDATRAEVERRIGEDERVRVICWRPGDETGFKNYAKIIANDGNDYLANLDADDWYEKAWLESMLAFMDKNLLEVAACGSRFVDEEGRLRGYRAVRKAFCVDRMQYPDFFPEMYQFCRAIWGKLYSRRIILSYDLTSFPKSEEYGGYGGDTIFVLETLKYAKRFGVSAEILHNYQVSDKSSSHTCFAEGRLGSDVLLFHSGENFLRQYGNVSRENERFLYAVYACAVRDTVQMIQKNMGAAQQAKAYCEIFEQELTIEAMKRSRHKELMEEEKGAYFRYMTELVLQGFHDLDEEQMQSCLASWCQLLMPQEVLLRSILQDSGFVRSYPELVSMIAHGDQKKAMKRCVQLLEMREDIVQERQLIEILLDLAAFLGDAECFISGKLRKLQYTIRNKDIRQAKREYQDLIEMGVSEEKLCGCLSESDKKIIGVH